MKRYEVVFDVHAMEEALDAADYIARSSPAASAKWFLGLEKLIESLASMPARFARARESDTLGIDLRQAMHHSHRVIFRIEENAGTVRVLHIRHAARRALGEKEIPES